MSLTSAAPDAAGLLSGQYWAELRIFAEVSQARSFNRAAERLGMSQPTIARKVRRLQDLIGAQLFVATKHGVRLTQRGEELAAAVRALDQSLFSIATDLKARDRDAEGIVRINISDGMAAFFAAPAVPSFSASHPRIQLHFRSAGAFTDLRENQADMMLSIMPVDRADLVCVEVGVLHFVPVATQSYIALQGAPTRETVAQHTFLQSHIYQSDMPAWRAWQEVCAQGRIAHFCDNPFAYGMLVKQGLGIGLLGSYTIKESSAVHCDLDIHVPMRMYVVALSERLAARPARLAFEWLCETFGETNPWFHHRLNLANLPAALPSLAQMLAD